MATAPRRAHDELLAILRDPERELLPGARPVVSVGERASRELLAAVDAASPVENGGRVELERRGHWHGEWAELDPARLPPGPWSVVPEPGAFQARWHAARPIVLRGVASAEVATHAEELASTGELHAELSEPGGLRRFLRARLADAGESAGESNRFELAQRATPFADPERDLERVDVSASRGPTKRVRDLWAKSAWLSTFEGEDSLRVRFSFGREVDDDESRDVLRHRLVAELAEIAFPIAASIADHPTLVPLVERCAREPVIFSQHIAYWNSPGGGASMHHDAFAADADPLLGPVQHGVCYVQLTGRTAWIALSTQDLARRVRRFGAWLLAGELAWVRGQLWPRATDWRAFERLLADDEALERELGLPGCGALGPLVNRGPEFTAFLADAGHAVVLGPGDAILLPNHGLARTCMHSVFCAGDERAFSLSIALRSARELDLE